MTVPRREPAEQYLPRGRISSENIGTWPHVCTDCRDPLAWGAADCSHGVPLCAACAKQRRIGPPVRDRMELAARLDSLRMAIAQDILTAQALLEGTAYEAEARSWGGLITGALEARGLPGTPALTMSRTIARLREPYLGGGGPY